MSNEACAYFKTLGSRIPAWPKQRKVLFVIADKMLNDCGFCKLGQAELSRLSKVSLRTVKKHLEILRLRGLIRIHNAKGRAGGGRHYAPIELVGFKDWLTEKRRQNQRGESAKTAASPSNAKVRKAGHESASPYIRNKTRTSYRTSGSSGEGVFLLLPQS